MTKACAESGNERSQSVVCPDGAEARQKRTSYTSRMASRKNASSSEYSEMRDAME